MERLDELKEFARLHARAQGIPQDRIQAILDRIRDDDPGSPHSWAAVWNAEAEPLARRGKHLDACSAYALARFPYPDSDEREFGQRRCVASFDRWRRGRKGIERLEYGFADGRVRCWAAGLNATKPRPLILVMGGIVSVKEQWAPLLPKLARLGMAGVVTELPGVGENTVTYTAESWRMIPHLLDRLEGRARVADTIVLAPSFGGHMALRAAAGDSRIARALTVGAPVTHFFTDRTWWQTMPVVTGQTLCHLTGIADWDGMLDEIATWAFTPEELAAVPAHVAYVHSLRDEITPQGEVEMLRRHLPNLYVREFDDVHGSPNNLPEMRLWLLFTLLRMRGVDDPRTRALGLVLRLRERRRERAARTAAAA